MNEEDQPARMKQAFTAVIRLAGLLLGSWALLPICGASEVTLPADGLTSGALIRLAPATTPQKTVELWNAPGQVTLLGQSHQRFRSAYAGSNRLEAGVSAKETADLTVFLAPGAGLAQRSTSVLKSIRGSASATPSELRDFPAARHTKSASRLPTSA